MAWYGYKRLYSGGPVVDVGLEITSLTRNQNSVSFSARVELKVISGGMWDQTGNARLGLTGCGEQSVSYRISQGGSQSWNFSGSVSASPTATSASLYSWFSGSEFTGNNSGDPWSISFEKYGTDPSGLTATLSDAGPDWADIAVSISSYGNPSASANRYIGAAVLGSSSYGSPYRYKTATAVTSATLHIDNTGNGSLTIVPNTQYRFGGYANNTVRSVSYVGSTFTTLPATPVVTATDQGHGVIDFVVTHANEGSALTVTDEYSADGGTTWTAISGGAFTLTLATQTEVIVRRSSSAGESTAAITVVPQFVVGIYASVTDKTKKIDKIYAPVSGQSKKVKKVYASVNGKTKLVYEDPS